MDDATRRYYEELLSAVPADQRQRLLETMVFPGPHLPALQALDMSPREFDMCGDTTAGVALAGMDIDPLAKAFCAGLDGSRRRDDE